MTLNNKPFLKNQVLGLYLSGDSQQHIANQLKISVGTVNSFLNEFMKSDDTVDLQRQIAIISKKNRVNLKQLAINLRWTNLVKRSCLDDRKMEKFLSAMEILCHKFSIPPSDLATQMFSILQRTLRENIEPDRLEEVIELRIKELREIESQIQKSKNLQDETEYMVQEKLNSLNITLKELEQFRQLALFLDIHNNTEISSEFGDLVHAFIEFKKWGYDPKVILSKYEQVENLTKAKEKLDKELQESEELLQNYRRKITEHEARWQDRGNALEIFNRLVKDGLKEEDIFIVVNVIKNDFPQIAIKKLAEQIEIYGNIRAAIGKSKREYNLDVEFPLESSDKLRSIVT